MEWIKDLPKTNWAPFLLTNRPKVSFATKKEQKSWCKNLLEQIIDRVDDGKIGTAIDLLSLGMYGDPEFLEKLRSNAVLRHSNYLGRKNPVSGMAKHLLQFAAEFGITEQDQSYLQSLIHFEVAHKELAHRHRAIDSEILRFRKAASVTIHGKLYKLSRVKALLALNDTFFLKRWEGDRFSYSANELEFYPKEEISEAISFLVARYNEIVGFSEDDLNLVDTQYAMSDSCRQLVVNACLYKVIKDLEISIEYYGYRCVKEGNRIRIEHPDTRFEKSIHLANINYEFQQLTNTHHGFNEFKEAASFRSLAALFHKASPDLFQLRKEPAERYVLLVPPLLYQRFLSAEEINFFREEAANIGNMSRELMIPIENFKDYELRPGLSFYSFLKLLRFFQLQYFLVEARMLELLEAGNEKMVIASCVGIFKSDDLRMFLNIVEEKSKVDIFLDMISWDTIETDQVLDLQYKPLIRHEGRYMVMPCLSGLSNLVRSIFLSEAKGKNNFKSLQIAKHKPVGQSLTEVFSEQGFITAMDLHVSYKTAYQNESDVDFLAYKDGVLFIAECKDTIHPTDLFELRTTLTHIKKAVTQLNHNMAALSDSAFKESFLKKMGIVAEEAKTVQTAIVLSNNKFYGHHFEGHPVRNVRELTAFVASGRWRYSLGDGIFTEVNLWKDATFSVDDLLHFCSEEGPHAIQFACMNERYLPFTPQIHQRIYTQNFYKVVAELKKMYRYEEKPLSLESEKESVK